MPATGEHLLKMAPAIAEASLEAEGEVAARCPPCRTGHMPVYLALKIPPNPEVWYSKVWGSQEPLHIPLLRDDLSRKDHLQKGKDTTRDVVWLCPAGTTPCPEVLLN